ncbi:MAG: D-alanine--D-alanine ligase family protein [Acidobacteriota bacterium]
MKVALIFGGRSHEHDVSIVSARSVAAALDEGGHEVLPMAIDRKGLWATGEESRRVLEGSGDRADQVLAVTGTHRLDPDLLSDSIDLAFPVLHGPFGEDGTIQGLFEMLDLPYVGSGVAGSALCMDKVRTKRMFGSYGLATAPWVTIDEIGWQTDPETLRRRSLNLGLPLFVKPSRMGSSVGITKVVDPEDLDGAIVTALQHDSTALVERGLEAREIEVAVLGNDEPRASIPGEIVPGADFYSFEDKYLNDNCRLLAPAPLDQNLTEQAQKLAISAFELLGCEGMARVDLFLEKTTGTLWVNEVNTIPGFTPISMYPKLWELSGLAYPDLVNVLLRLAIERHTDPS